MKQDCDLFFSINYSVQEYRKNFLKRKNINGYKKTHKNTPILLDKLINAFDRKIHEAPILKNEVKIDYFKGLNNIFNQYYTETFQPRMSKQYAYHEYVATNYCLYGKKTYKSITLTFKEFVKSGLVNKYR
jgi:hypothetical protein